MLCVLYVCVCVCVCVCESTEACKCFLHALTYYGMKDESTNKRSVSEKYKVMLYCDEKKKHALPLHYLREDTHTRTRTWTYTHTYTPCSNEAKTTLSVPRLEKMILQ